MNQSLGGRQKSFLRMSRLSTKRFSMSTAIKIKTADGNVVIFFLAAVFTAVLTLCVCRAVVPSTRCAKINNFLLHIGDKVLKMADNSEDSCGNFILTHLFNNLVIGTDNIVFTFQ